MERPGLIFTDMKRTTTDRRLRNVRRARTLTQCDMARLVGVSQVAISRYEAGAVIPPVDVQARIAAILGTSADDLFGEPVPAHAEQSH